MTGVQTCALPIFVNEESDEFFENNRLVEILLERGVSSDDRLFVRFLKNMDVE